MAPIQQKEEKKVRLSEFTSYDWQWRKDNNPYPALLLSGGIFINSIKGVSVKEELPRIFIRDLETQEEVYSFHVSAVYNSASYDRMMRGLIRKTDTDRFYVDESECETWEMTKRLRGI